MLIEKYRKLSSRVRFWGIKSCISHHINVIYCRNSKNEESILRLDPAVWCSLLIPASNLIAEKLSSSSSILFNFELIHLFLKPLMDACGWVLGKSNYLLIHCRCTKMLRKATYPFRTTQEMKCKRNSVNDWNFVLNN